MRNRILAAVFGLQVVILVVVFLPESAPPPAEQLFPGLTQDQVARVSIADFDGRRIQLAVTADGCVLPDADNYPCKGDELDSLLGKIVAMTTDRLVTQTASSHGRLGVAARNFPRLIEFELVDGTSHGLYLGTSPRVGSLHVRADGRNEVYLTTGLFESDAAAEALAWIEPVYYKVAQDAVTSMSVVNSKGGFELRKDEAGQWSLTDQAEGEELDQSAARTLTFRLSSLSMRRPLGLSDNADYGLQDPAALVKFETKDADGRVESHTIRVGAPFGQDDEYIAKSSTTPYYLTMGAYSVSDFLGKERGDFLLPASAEEADAETP